MLTSDDAEAHAAHCRASTIIITLTPAAYPTSAVNTINNVVGRAPYEVY